MAEYTRSIFIIHQFNNAISHESGGAYKKACHPVKNDMMRDEGPDLCYLQTKNTMVLMTDLTKM